MSQLGEYGLDVGPVMTADHVSDGAITLKFLDEEIFEDAAFFGDIPDMYGGAETDLNCPDLFDRMAWSPATVAAARHALVTAIC
jgi:hypothetical protein